MLSSSLGPKSRGKQTATIARRAPRPEKWALLPRLPQARDAMTAQAVSMPPAEARQAPRREERRRHRVYVTRHLEYHTRDGVCVAVKDRMTGAWLRGHVAVDRGIVGTTPIGGDRVGARGGDATTPGPEANPPSGPFALCFADPRVRLVSARIDAIVRPPREEVERYP